MGGFFTKQLRNSVTHLVTDSVMSAKYEVCFISFLNVYVFYLVLTDVIHVYFNLGCYRDEDTNHDQRLGKSCLGSKFKRSG